MKKILFILIFLLPITLLAQDKIQINGNGSYNIIEDKKEPEIPKILDRGEGVTDEQIEMFAKAGKDISYYESSNYDIIQTSWYLSTKISEDKIDLFLEKETLNSKTTKDFKAVIKPHRVLTIILYAFLAYLTYLSVWLIFKRSPVGVDVKKKRFALYSCIILIVSVLAFVLGIITSDFNRGVAFFILALTLTSVILAIVEEWSLGMYTFPAWLLIVGILAMAEVSPFTAILFGSIGVYLVLRYVVFNIYKL